MVSAQQEDSVKGLTDRLSHADLFLPEMVEKGLWHLRLSLVPTTFRVLPTVSLQPESIFF